jgi:hypothetical protein
VKKNKILNLVFVLLLLYGAVPLLSKEDPNSVQWTKVEFTGGKAFMVYIFELSLLRNPIGIDNPPPWNPRNIEHDYFQEQVDRKKLEDLHGRIQKRISQDNNYSFVILDEFSDENKITLRDTMNSDIMFCYDGLVFWVEINFNEIDLDSLLKHAKPSFETFFPNKGDTYKNHRNKILGLLENEISIKYLPKSPFGSGGDQNQSVTPEFAHWIVILEQPFFLYNELGDSYLCSWENYCKDETCINTVKRFAEYWSYNFDPNMAFFSNETFLVIGNYEFDDYAFRFNDMVLLLNINRTLHEWAPPLRDAYYHSPTSVFPYEATSNLYKLDRMAAFVSFAKYASYDLEKGPEADISPFYGEEDFLSKQLVEIHRFISMVEEDIRNHIGRNEHALTKFAVYFAILIALISFFASLITGKRLKNIRIFKKLFFYLVPLIFAFLAYYLSSRFSVFVNVMNARYMLSALAQSEAAVIAIFVTITLIGIQLGATYSPRIARIFSKSSEFKVLIFSYVFAILYSLWVLGTLKANYDIHIRISYSLGVFCFVFLISYVIHIFNIIEPSGNIEELSHKIIKENILNKKDVIQPIIDIVKGSIKESDVGTARFGLDIIGDRVIDIFEKEEFDEQEQKEINKKIFSYFAQVCDFSMYRDVRNSAIAAISNIEKIGIKAIEEGLEKIAGEAALYLSILGNDRRRVKFAYVAIEAVYSLSEMGKSAIENDSTNTKKIIEYIGVIKDKTDLQPVKNKARNQLEYLKRIAEENGNNKLALFLRDKYIIPSYSE